jgi:uncharacterized protein
VSAGDAVCRKLVTFGRILREAGVEVGPGRLQRGLQALDAVDLASRDEVYWALACTLVSKHDDMEIFDRAFRAWFERAPQRTNGARPPELGLDFGQGQDEPRQAVQSEDAMQDVGDDETDAGSAAWSAEEILRDQDFATMTREELERVRAACERLARSLPRRRSRRLEAAPDGDHIDPRRTLRMAMRNEGEAVQRAFRDQKLVERRVVFLCDISGSMEPYARALILFLQAAVATGRRVEAFTFGTRLTRLTPFLDGRDVDRALDRAARQVRDWAGGTRIGESLHTFNDTYTRRGLTRGAIVVIASDGWERGDCTLLGREMATLHRRCRAIVWANPLKGSPDYRPIAGGMAAALPHVDVFLPGHNLRALETLVAVVEHLGKSGRGRIDRRIAA